MQLGSLLCHISSLHKGSWSFTCYCPVERYFRKFYKYDTLYKHVKKDHKAYLTDDNHDGSSEVVAVQELQVVWRGMIIEALIAQKMLMNLLVRYS